MAKTWEQLTPIEKIEDLRRDVVRLFANLRGIDDRLSVSSAEISALRAKLSRLEDQAPKSGRRTVKGGAS